MKTWTQDKLTVYAFEMRAEMGAAAARACVDEMRRLLDEKESIRMIFAAAPSQNEFLAGLVRAGLEGAVDFRRVYAFHMDEYVGLDRAAPQGFGNFLRERLFECLPFADVCYLNGNADDPAQECARYTRLLREEPIDIVCMGIGENGHVAFNDPPVAQFDDPLWVKPVALDAVCRQQQVNDGCFASLQDVPTHALTLTVPALMQARTAFCVVPAASKAASVRATLTGPIAESCPASVLRRHPHATLWLDADSAAGLDEQEAAE